MIRATKLSYEYPGSGRGISDVSLQAASGVVTALVGPSGTGKSTILACLGGVLSPDSGEVTFGRGRSEPLGRHACALITQNSSLFEELQVWENVALAYGVPRRSVRRRALDVLDRLDIRELASARPSELSLGQRQRVAIAAALAQDARVILADEPTGSLDAVNSKRVLSALRAAAQTGSVVLIATHDPLIVSEADSVLTLESQEAMQ